MSLGILPWVSFWAGTPDTVSLWPDEEVSSGPRGTVGMDDRLWTLLSWMTTNRYRIDGLFWWIVPFLESRMESTFDLSPSKDFSSFYFNLVSLTVQSVVHRPCVHTNKTLIDLSIYSYSKCRCLMTSDILFPKPHFMCGQRTFWLTQVLFPFSHPFLFYLRVSYNNITPTFRYLED